MSIFLPRKQRRNGVFPKGGYRSYVRKTALPGATKFSRVWLIPKDAEKPIDGRIKKERSYNMNNVLIIDDDKELCVLIKRSILSEDIEADFCNTGKEAW